MMDVRTVAPLSTEFKPSNFQWDWYSRFARSVKRSHTLLISDHGIGKTYAARTVAAELNVPVWYVSASHGLERSHLEGHYRPAPAGEPTKVQAPDDSWHVVQPGVQLEAWDGIVASAVQNKEGALLVIDEFFRLPGDVRSTLFAAMDTHGGDYTIAYRGHTFSVHPNFRVVGCTNPPSPLYPEVEVADRALLSRFGSVLRLPFPTDKEIARFMKHIGFPRDYVVRVVQFVRQIKQAYDKGDLDNFVSPRDVVFVAQALTAGLTLDESLEDSLYGKFSDRYREALSGLWASISKGATNATAAA